MVIYLGCPLPNTSSGSPHTGREKDQPLTLRPCSQPGFTEPAPLDTAGALLPHLCTLTLSGGIFLWHFPRDRSHWGLSSKFGLSGARTFLTLVAEPATITPTLSCYYRRSRLDYQSVEQFLLLLIPLISSLHRFLLVLVANFSASLLIFLDFPTNQIGF